VTRHIAICAALAVGCGSSQPAPRPPAPAVVDTAAHTVRRVEVATGVSLEVLDFGGTGTPIVLLAGLGNTAHVFDDFAPALTSGHRVVGITRRGFGSSSTTDTGYDVATRASDDLAVLDALGFDRAILVGHSLAGDELTELAATHGERVAALVYIDAAHDHAAIRAVLATAPKDLDRPPPRSAFASVTAFGEWIRRFVGFELSRGELLASLVLGPHGEVVDMRDRPITTQRYLEGATSQDFTRVHAPALVLMAEWTEATHPGYQDLDAGSRGKLHDWFPRMAAVGEATRVGVKRDLAGARVGEVEHGHHYMFITEQHRVLEEIRAFLDATTPHPRL
jgi:pimeloyl-ACP methyl ester carboxylesterase